MSKMHYRIGVTLRDRHADLEFTTDAVRRRDILHVLANAVANEFGCRTFTLDDRLYRSNFWRQDVIRLTPQDMRLFHHYLIGV